MRILFVSSTAIGGSGISQRQLARRLAERGHDVVLLADSEVKGVRRYLYRRQVNLTTKLRGTRWRGPLLPVQRRFGRAVRVDDSREFPTWFSQFPENGYKTVRRWFEPDVVVASSIDRVTWRRLRGQLLAEGIPSVLYLREESAIGHLTISDAPPDVLLANAHSHAAVAEALGYTCQVIPSVIDVGRARVDSTRVTALLINPIHSHGGDLVWELADRCPEISFVLQESWPLDDGAWSALEILARARGNVVLRRRVDDPAVVYQDARVLLVPHRVDNRPRVIAEAQSNGIPILASDHPGLAEAMGPGGIALSRRHASDEWVAELRRLWGDSGAYDHLAQEARVHARRPANDADEVTSVFEAAMAELIADHDERYR